MSAPKKILVKNTAPHPAMRIPPGGRGKVDESVVAIVDYLVPVQQESAPQATKPSKGKRGR